MKFWGPKEIKVHVSRWISSNKAALCGKTVLDIPAGSGFSSRLLKDAGANVKAYDLFPDLFKVDGLNCHFADITETLPIASNSADVILCQEGIEHVADQLQVFKELARVLRSGGTLLLTTPNYSNLRSRMSYLMGESENFGKSLGPHEHNSVWYSGGEQVYFGHVFLVGILKLRLFSKLAGFRIKTLHEARVNNTSLFLFPIFYPLILFYSWRAYRRELRKSPPEAIAILKEIFRWSIHPAVLLQGHLILEFELEERAAEEVSRRYANLDFNT